METGVTLFLEEKFQRGSCADETMERKLKRRTCEDNRTREPIWMIEEIRCEIKNRSELNTPIFKYSIAKNLQC